MFANRLFRTVAVALVTTTLISGVADAGNGADATVTEYIQLPKFCWELYGGPKGPEFEIPQGCGIGTNHYCYGLLDLQRGKKAKDKTARNIYFSNAKKNALYTMNWIKREGVWATCPMSAHVEATMQEIELQMKIHNIK